MNSSWLDMVFLSGYVGLINPKPNKTIGGVLI